MHHAGSHVRRLATLQSKVAPSSVEVRNSFLEFFEKSHGHLVVPSSPVAPLGNPTSFVNAGMNQFRNAFLGLGAPISARVANCQKCIRIKGKHNDLSLVGADGSHHTFFEMLGNWSFGDYFKKEACSMSWELLTKVYGIPPERLYVTYFGGDETLGLSPDVETCEIWKEIGVKPERVLPFGMKDNFWEMGRTGPCGPCTEIHYDAVEGRTDAGALLNTGLPNLTELWNLVFIQYNRENDALEKLEKGFVDTGMGFERLVAVLQGRESNYDTDLFRPLFDAICSAAKCPPYGGSYDGSELDASYRLLADHMRMLTVAINDGIFPNMNHRIRLIFKKASKVSRDVFNVKKGLMKELSSHVARSLAPAYPDIEANIKRIQDVVEHEEENLFAKEERAVERWMQLLKEYPQMAKIRPEWTMECIEGVNYLVHSYLKKEEKRVTEADAWKLMDSFGLPLEFVEKSVEVFGLELDKEAFESYRKGIIEDMTLAGEKKQEPSRSLTKIRRELMDRGVPATERRRDANEAPAKQAVRVVGFLVNDLVVDALDPAELEDDAWIGIVFDKTHFSSRTSHRFSDGGVFSTDDNVFFRIKIVKDIGDYVAHYGTLTTRLEKPVPVGSSGVLEVDESMRQGLRRGCTAAHVIGHSLHALFPSVKMIKSTGAQDNFSVSFVAYNARFTVAELEQLENSAKALVDQALKVERKKYDVGKLPSLEFVSVLGECPTERDVSMVELGDGSDVKSRHMCTGCHVMSTHHIRDIVVTTYHTPNYRVREVTGVTGSLAEEARKNNAELLAEWEKIEMLCQEKITRERLQELVDRVQRFVKKDISRYPSSYIVRQGILKRAANVVRKLERKKMGIRKKEIKEETKEQKKMEAEHGQT